MGVWGWLAGVRGVGGGAVAAEGGLWGSATHHAGTDNEAARLSVWGREREREVGGRERRGSEEEEREKEVNRKKRKRERVKMREERSKERGRER